MEFFRTKNGNLLRSATIKTASMYVDCTETPQLTAADHYSRPPKKPAVQCEHFTKNGIFRDRVFQQCPPGLTNPSILCHLLVSSAVHI